MTYDSKLLQKLFLGTSFGTDAWNCVNLYILWYQDTTPWLKNIIEDKWYRADDIEIGNRQFIVLDPDGYMLRFAEELGERKIIKE